MVKVIQSLGWYFPESTGGSEVYVAGLTEHLRALGVDCSIAAASDGKAEQHYVHAGTQVYRYPVLAERSLEQLAGWLPHGGFESFLRWLDSQRADIYHQHSWTFGCGLHHLLAARERGLATVLTVHVPAPICLRGTLLMEGQYPCDGAMQQQRCASCWLQQRGLPSVPRGIISHLPTSLGRSLRRFGRIGTALSATSLVRRHKDMLLEAAASADRVVAVCQWLYDALLLNGVPRDKLSLNRQGVSTQPVLAERTPKDVRPLKVGFLGRWDPIKGIGVLVNAVLQLPACVDVEVYIHAVEPNDPAMLAYMAEVSSAAAADRRIRMLPPLAVAAVPGFLRSIDVLAVPSQWYETGPLVVLESFAVGTPVIGSDLGGIRELVQHGRNGWLVPFDDLQGWALALQQLAESPAIVEQMANGIGPVRTMHDVAIETKQLYLQLPAPAAS